MRTALVALSILAGMLLLPATAAAAGSCQLATTLRPGHEITVTGTGFPASTVVDIKQTWSGSNATAGGNTGPQTSTSQVTSDPNGDITFTIPAGPGHGGTYDIVAAAGGCTAKTQAIAVETAGGINGGGTAGGGATPPATDTAPLTTGGGAPVAPLAAVIIGIALVGAAFALRRARTA